MRVAWRRVVLLHCVLRRGQRRVHGLLRWLLVLVLVLGMLLVLVVLVLLVLLVLLLLR